MEPSVYCWRLTDKMEETMRLAQLLNTLEYEVKSGSLDCDITSLVYDSRKAEEGCVFVCIKGTVRDSHEFIGEVSSKGAKAVIIEADQLIYPANLTVIKVENSRKALAVMAANYFGQPAKQMTMIGLTGTKGKTTTSYMIQHVLEQAGKKVGVIGTIGAVIDGVKKKTENTTPESYELQRIFSEMVEAGCEYCVMEVSSQGLKMDRVAGVTFDIGVFTNFSNDHIGPNEHASLEEYLYCKSLLFKQCKTGIINIDDEHAEGVTKGHTCTIKTYGFDTRADLYASDIKLVTKKGYLGIAYQANGLINDHIQAGTPGKFSIYNSMAALMVANELEIDIEAVKRALLNIQVRGRVEIVPVSDKFTIMIDYAHNAASVESLLSTIKEYNPKRIVCVYGCGGERSKLRRYDMGELCGKMADLSILTCDNPRGEEIEAINEDIKVGLKRSNGKYITILDRAEAVHYSMDHAEEGDVIILLGKGHEDYQEIKGQKYHYNELEVVEAYRDQLREKEMSLLEGIKNS